MFDEVFKRSSPLVFIREFLLGEHPLRHNSSKPTNKKLSFPKLVLARDRQQAVPLGNEFFQMNFAA